MKRRHLLLAAPALILPHRSRAQVCSAPIPPPQATGAGFNTLVFNDNFGVDSVARSGQTSGFNWYPLGNNSLPFADIQVNTTTGTLTITSDTSGFSYGVGTISKNAPTTGFWKQGYFECQMQYSPTGHTTGAWPAFWSFDTTTIGTLLSNGTTFGELDFLEAFPGGTEGATSGNNGVTLLTTVHQWTSNGVTNTPSGGSVQNSDVATLPGGAGFDFTQFHTYGCLWTNSAISWYIDNLLACGPVALPGNFPKMQTNSMYMILGTGLNWPTQFRNVHIFQGP